MSGQWLFFLGVACTFLVAGLSWRSLRQAQLRRERVRQRLQTLAPHALDDDALEVGLTDDWLLRLVSQTPRPIRVRLARADIRPQGALAPPLLLVSAGLLALAWRWGGPVGAGLALTLLAALPAFWIQRRARSRMAAFNESLPHFLDALRQLLTAGHALPQAFNRAAKAAPSHMSAYLAPAVRRISNGAPPPEAISLAANRIDCAELHMLATAARTNLRYGGPLGPLLKDLAAMMRDRARLERELAAATAETRMSGQVLSVLPLAAIALLCLVNLDYVRFLWTTDLGQRLLWVGGALQLSGMLVMRRLMRVAY